MNAGSRKSFRDGPMRPTYGGAGSFPPARRRPCPFDPRRHDDERRNAMKMLKALALGLALTLAVP